MTIQFSLPAGYQHLEKVSTAIDELISQVPTPTGSEQVIYSIKLAVHEICNNIIEHAYGEQDGVIQINLTIDATAQQFVARLYDTGEKFDPSTIAMPDLSEPREEGYGLFLARELMDEVHYTRQGDENHWQLVKRW
jgi:serine/threonine-protein kinase RsbW